MEPFAQPIKKAYLEKKNWTEGRSDRKIYLHYSLYDLRARFAKERQREQNLEAACLRVK